MTWLNPWAWGGLVALALPVLIHLLARGHARVQPFPSLRFLSASRLLPTRRTRVHEWLLLATRLGILAAAVAALARPLLLTPGRTRALNDGLARAILVDTSASMAHRTADGTRAVDAALSEARRLAGEARLSVVLRSATPSRLIAGAVAWLEQQPGRRELVVVSDLQLGTLGAPDLAAVPAGTGLRIVRVAVVRADTSLETHSVGLQQTIVRTTLSAAGTEAEWRDGASVGDDDGIRVLASPAERASADAAVRAARAVGVRLPLDTARRITVVFPGYGPGSAISRGVTAPRASWMIDALTRLVADSLLATVAARASPMVATDTTKSIVVARNANGAPIVVAAQATADGSDRLLLFVNADAGTLVSAALVAAATRVRSRAEPLEELEPRTLPASVIDAWQRAPASDATTAANGADRQSMSDGRWLWMLALGLLALETWMRRARPAALPVPKVNERAA